MTLILYLLSLVEASFLHKKMKKHPFHDIYQSHPWISSLETVTQNARVHPVSVESLIYD